MFSAPSKIAAGFLEAATRGSAPTSPRRGPRSNSSFSLGSSDDYSGQLSSQESNSSPVTAQSLSLQFHKTRFCPFFAKGHCRKGNHCTYAHGRTELQTAPDLFKTKLCEGWQKGTCNDEYCRFAHGRQELRFTDMVYKTRICHFWATGDCNKGNLCRHAHGYDELKGGRPSRDIPTLSAPGSRTLSKQGSIGSQHSARTIGVTESGWRDDREEGHELKHKFGDSDEDSRDWRRGNREKASKPKWHPESADWSPLPKTQFERTDPEGTEAALFLLNDALAALQLSTTAEDPLFKLGDPTDTPVNTPPMLPVDAKAALTTPAPISSPLSFQSWRGAEVVDKSFTNGSQDTQTPGYSRTSSAPNLSTELAGTDEPRFSVEQLAKDLLSDIAIFPNPSAPASPASTRLDDSPCIDITLANVLQQFLRDQQHETVACPEEEEGASSPLEFQLWGNLIESMATNDNN